MPRILYIHHGGGLGGAPLSLLYLLQQLDRSRYEPIVLTFKPGPVVDLYQQNGLETHVAHGATDFSHTELEWYGGINLWRLPIQLVGFFKTIGLVRQYIRQFKPDLIHLNSSTLAAAAQAAQLENIPVVWHIREPLNNGYTGLRRNWLKNQIHQHATRIIAISDFDASRLTPSPNIRVIHNFVDFKTFDRALAPDEARRKFNLTPTQNIVTLLGGVAYPKGTLPFVQALPLVRQHLPNTKFLIAGPPPAVGDSDRLKSTLKFILQADAYDRRVMKAATDSIASGHIRFLGQRTDIPQVLAATDILAFPSVVPHFARPILEAGAMAKPVVASRLGGPLELVQENVTGLLVPPNDPPALAEALVALLKNPQRLTQLGEAGYTQAREKFEAVKNAGRTFEIYDEILK